MEKTKVSLTNFKEFSPDETPSWVINVIISDTDKEYSKFCEPIFEILQPLAEKTIFELKNPVHVRDVSFIEEEDDTISYHLWDKINELAGLKGKSATLRAIVKDLYGNEYPSNEINIDDFFI
ncbi:MAG: hypothetical protein ACFNP4_10080 [Capnocytophaga gingivalis]|uniref:hypothetical protein n=1 Tax=Capnocytophaga gingivalis TaxID=1017 RepID=UPI00360C4429